MVNLDWTVPLHGEVRTVHSLLHVISVLLWVTTTLLKPGLGVGEGWMLGDGEDWMGDGVGWMVGGDVGGGVGGGVGCGVGWVVVVGGGGGGRGGGAAVIRSGNKNTIRWWIKPT